MPVFVVTHDAREPVAKDGGTTFTFVTDGIESALEQAREAADGKDVALGGGANVAQQYLKAGLIDEVQIHLVPVLLGEGIPLFPSGFPQREFSLLENKTFSKGMIALNYARSRRKPRKK